MNQLVFSVLLTASIPSAPALKESATADRNSLQGTWEVRGYTFDGYQAADYVTAKMTVNVRDDDLLITPLEKMKIVPPEKESFGIVKPFNAKMSIDPTSIPKTIDLRRSDNSKVLGGIYRLDGESLLFCFSTAGSRPAQFKAEKRSDCHLFILKRPAR